MFSILLLIPLVFSDSVNKTRVLENNDIKLTLSRRERLEAEPASQPYEIYIKIDCKKNKYVRRAEIAIPVCDFDLQDKETQMTSTSVKLAHFSWDAVKSSNNPEGQVYCDPKNKIFQEIQFSEICKETKKTSKKR